MSAFRKKEAFTITQPIPGFIPRQLAVDILHDHREFITLNPLVTGHAPIPPPPEAATDESHWKWYAITERIQLMPGLGKMGAKTITFDGCFMDTRSGLRTHIYAPMNIDMRANYRVAGGNGERPSSQNVGLAGSMYDGIYLQADIECQCSIALAGIVRSQCKEAIKEMVDRMVKKAERMDADELSAMLKGDKGRSGSGEEEHGRKSSHTGSDEAPLQDLSSWDRHPYSHPSDQQPEALHSSQSYQRPKSPLPEAKAYQPYREAYSTPAQTQQAPVAYSADSFQTLPSQQRQTGTQHQYQQQAPPQYQSQTRYTAYTPVPVPAPLKVFKPYQVHAATDRSLDTKNEVEVVELPVDNLHPPQNPYELSARAFSFELEGSK